MFTEDGGIPSCTDSSGEIFLAKDDIELLRNVDCRSIRVAVIGDMLVLGPPKSTFNNLMFQVCCDVHFNVVVLVGTRFFTAAGNINYTEEIKLVYPNDAHSMTSEISNFYIMVMSFLAMTVVKGNWD